MLCWFGDRTQLRPGAKYAIKHTSKWARALVKDLQYRLDVNTLHRDEDADSLSLNEIGRVTMRTTQPLFFDEYRRNRGTGSFVLVEEATNDTIAAGMILGPSNASVATALRRSGASAGDWSRAARLLREWRRGPRGCGGRVRDASDYEAARPSYPPDAVRLVRRPIRAGTGPPGLRLRGGHREVHPAARADRRRTDRRRAGRGDARPVPAGGAGCSAARRDRRGGSPFRGRSPSTRCSSRKPGTGSTTTGPARRCGGSCATPGGVGLIWNARDRGVPWVDAIWAIMDRVEKRAPWRDHDELARIGT